jgi:hypothetical protein
LYNAKWAIVHLYHGEYHGENRLYFWWDEDDLSLIKLYVTESKPTVFNITVLT